MRILPQLTYTGLTIILDRPSRFDNGGLIMGNAGSWVDSSLAACGHNRHTVEVRTLSEAHQPFLPNTKAVLLLGEQSLHRYLPDVTLGEQRGCPFVIDGIPYVASYQPQDCYDRYNYFSSDENEENDNAGETETAEAKSTHGKTRRKNWRFWLRQDIKKCGRIALAGMFAPRPNYRLWPDIHSAIGLLTTTKGQYLYLDIETDSNLQMTCFGFSFDSQDIYVVPMLQTDRPVKEYYYGDTHKILRALAVAIRDNTVVIHNAMFDLFVLAWRYGIPLEGRVYDTMLAHTRCYIEIEKSLGHCISLYTDLPYHKNTSVFEPHNHHQTQQLYEYNGKDVFALTQIKPKIDETATRLGATESVEQVNRMVLPYLTMSLQGMNLDVARIVNLVSDNDRRKFQIKRILHGLTGGMDFNPNSHQQVSRYLYANTFTNTTTGRTFRIPKPKEDPTNEKTLLSILLKHEIPAIHAIIKYRGVGKQSSQCKFQIYGGVYRGKNVPSSLTRLTCAYNLGRTTTMRLGSRKLLRRWGSNCQNLTEELRKIVIPDNGKVLVQADQSGAEALIVAYLCRDGQYRDIFTYGINPHCFLALHLFHEQFSAELGYPLKGYTQLPARDLVKESKWPEIAKVIKASDGWPIRYYFVAKQGNHSLNYSVGARMFRINTLLKSEGTVALSMEDAEKVVRTRSLLFPEIHSWHNEVVMEIRKTGLIRNLFQHPRVITGFIDESVYKEYYAFVPQSTVGQISNYAILELHELNIEGLDVLVNTHDGCLVQCPKEQKEVAGRILQKHFNRKLTSPRGETFYMKSDLKWSESSWGEMKELKV